MAAGSRLVGMVAESILVQFGIVVKGYTLVAEGIILLVQGYTLVAEGIIFVVFSSVVAEGIIFVVFSSVVQGYKHLGCRGHHLRRVRQLGARSPTPWLQRASSSVCERTQTSVCAWKRLVLCLLSVGHRLWGMW